MVILGIETSCDESALALIETRNDGKVRVVNSLIHSQAELHSAYGGVYPHLAKREHGKNLVPLLYKLFADLPHEVTMGHEEVGTTIDLFRADLAAQNPDLFESLDKHWQMLANAPKIDAIAVTEGPGLEPTLWVGINFARFLAALWKVPVIPINHMEGHVIGSLLESDAANGKWQQLKPIKFPSLALLISGGHTEIVKVDQNWQYTILGQTKDDAVGEAFDKVARLLDLPYPGGPHISMLAEQATNAGLKSSVKLPRPMITSGDLDFSFSGLKTAVLYSVRKAKESNAYNDEFRKTLALEFETAITETLEAKLKKALTDQEAHSLIIGGGVSANNKLRAMVERVTTEFGIPVYLPSRHISGDNALMIALAAALHAQQNPASISENRVLKANGTKKLG